MAVYNLLGGGTQALTSGTSRLLVDITTYPRFPQTGQASPTNYFHVGLLRIGIQGSYGPVRPIDASSIYIDLPDGATTLGYSLFDVAAIRVTEVASAVVGNPLRVVMHNEINAPANATTALWSYTVPANRVFRLGYYVGGMTGGVGGTSQTQFYFTFGRLRTQYNLSNGVSNEYAESTITGPVYFVAADVLAAQALNSTTLALGCFATLLGVEFDASSFGIFQ